MICNISKHVFLRFGIAKRKSLYPIKSSRIKKLKQNPETGLNLLSKLENMMIIKRKVKQISPMVVPMIPIIMTNLKKLGMF
jgi:hypothetical protein